MAKEVNRSADALHPRFTFDLENCGIKRALDVLGEKWTMLILREAFYGLQRFDDFSRALRCGRGVLSLRLKSLVRHGVLEQRDYLVPGHRSRAAYHLTGKGRDLYPVLLALSQWSDRWNLPKSGPSAIVTARGSGKPVRVIMTDQDNVRPLSRDEVAIGLGPGAKRLSPRQIRSHFNSPETTS